MNFSINRGNESSSSVSNLSILSKFKNSSSNMPHRSRSSVDLELNYNFEVPGHEKAFQYIKTVGHGSFGVACLYRRLKDDVLVVLKRINLMELTKQEKDMAMNEVDVFSKLNHPNIIQYYGSFVRGEVLYIGRVNDSFC